MPKINTESRLFQGVDNLIVRLSNLLDQSVKIGEDVVFGNGTFL